MTKKKPEERAEEWLFANGYSQFSDGTWQIDGDELDIADVLAEYMRHEDNSRP